MGTLRTALSRLQFKHIKSMIPLLNEKNAL